MPSLLHPSRLTGVLAMVLAILLLAAPAAQEPSPDQDQREAQEPLVFRGGIDAVTVDVTVTDRNGRPVTDLTIDDFEVREEGEPQTVTMFRLVETGDGTGPAAEREILSLDEERTELARLDNRLFVIFLDDYHVRRGNSMRVRQQLAEFLSSLTRNDLVAIATPLSGVAGLTFSRNHNLTSNTVMGFEGRKYEYEPRHPIEYRYSTLPIEQQEQMRNSLVITALQNLCEYLGTVREGRKAIVYVSEGMSGYVPDGVRTTGTWQGSTPLSRPNTPFRDSMDFFENTSLLSELESRVFRAAARGNVSIYSLDPRGLSNFEFGVNDYVDPDVDRRVLQESTDVLRVIAERTDGRAIVANNDPLPALRQMVRDVGTYYLLGYTSSRSPRDGRFHRITVRVRRPGVEVRARRGYWALTNEDIERNVRASRPEPPREVSDALGSMRAATNGISRRAVNTWVGAERGSDGLARVTFAWEGATGGAAGTARAIDRVAIVATTRDGVEVFSGVAPRPGTAASGGVVSFDAPPGPLRIRITPEDGNGARVDSDETTFEVPDYTAVGPVVTTPFVYRGRTARDMQQIRQAEAPMPAVTPTFSRLERALLRFGVHAPGSTPPTVKLRLLNQLGDELAALPPPRALDDTGRYEAEIAFGSFPPGEYLVEIAATQGEATATQLVALRIGS